MNHVDHIKLRAEFPGKGDSILDYPEPLTCRQVHENTLYGLHRKAALSVILCDPHITLLPSCTPGQRKTLSTRLYPKESAFAIEF